MTELEVFTTESGLAVVTEDTEGVRRAARGVRRAVNRSEAQRRAQRRTGGSKGMATWIRRAKASHKTAKVGQGAHR